MHLTQNRFPSDQEFLFSPMAWINSIKRKVPQNLDGIVRFEVQVTSNNRNITVDEFQQQEKNMHLQLFRFNQAELAIALEKKLREFMKGHDQAKVRDKPQVQSKPAASSAGDSGAGTQDRRQTELNEICGKCDQFFEFKKEKNVALLSRAISTQDIVKRILNQYDEVFESHQKLDAEKFGDDTTFRAVTTDMFETKLFSEQKLTLWLQYHTALVKQHGDKVKIVEPDRAFDIFHFPLRSCNRMYLIELRRELENARHDLELLDSEPKSSVNRAELLNKCRRLCMQLLKAKGRIPLDSKEEHVLNWGLPTLASPNLAQMHPLLEAACSGWGEEDVVALLDLGVSVQTVLQPVTQHNCVHVASMHGNVYFLQVVLKRIDDDSKKDPSAIKVRDLIFLQEGETEPPPPDKINLHPRRTALYMAAGV